MDDHLPVTYAHICAAAENLFGVSARTPVLTSGTVNRSVGASVYFKCENFQRMGAFKFRGAYHALSSLDCAQKRQGVVAYSSGNHAQAVALAGRLLNIPAVIVMPDDAPTVKQDATREYGAEVVTYDRRTTDREHLARQLADTRGLAVIPPFDHPHVISGQGTAAKELLEEVGKLDYLFVPTGGGGLISGCAIAAKHLSPGIRVIGVEPTAGDDVCRSFKSGVLQTVHNPDTVADGARTSSAGKLTFPLIMRHVDDMTCVDDETLLRTMFYLWERMKIVVEPTGALGAAAVLEGGYLLDGKRVGVIISGGNVDIGSLSRMTGAGLSK